MLFYACFLLWIQFLHSRYFMLIILLCHKQNHGTYLTGPVNIRENDFKNWFTTLNQKATCRKHRQKSGRKLAGNVARNLAMSGKVQPEKSTRQKCGSGLVWPENARSVFRNLAQGWPGLDRKLTKIVARYLARSGQKRSQKPGRVGLENSPET